MLVLEMYVAFFGVGLYWRDTHMCVYIREDNTDSRILIGKLKVGRFVYASDICAHSALIWFLQ